MSYQPKSNNDRFVVVTEVAEPPLSYQEFMFGRIGFHTCLHDGQGRRAYSADYNGDHSVAEDADQGTPVAVTGFFCNSIWLARLASVASLSTPLAQHQSSTSCSVTSLYGTDGVASAKLQVL
jgi:hypothetical protein